MRPHPTWSSPDVDPRRRVRSLHRFCMYRQGVAAASRDEVELRWAQSPLLLCAAQVSSANEGFAGTSMQTDL